MNNKKIDIVILWVDGNDPKWIEEKEKYKPSKTLKDIASKNRYREWDNLKYWFRCIEKNMDWYNKIFFVTWGHVPEWLNLNNPKLKIVKHSDFIPEKYLPTFNSSTIEMNLFRIEELSDNFIFFNDDMFAINQVDEEDFFINDLPVEYYGEECAIMYEPNEQYVHRIMNNFGMINKYYKKHEVYKRNIFKYFNCRYGFRQILKNLFLLHNKCFSELVNLHVPVALKKSTMEKIWKLEPELMDKASENKFRNYNDITQGVVRGFQVASGEFYPKKLKEHMSFPLKNDNTDIVKEVIKKKYKTVCFNDNKGVTDFEKSKTTLNSFFEENYKEKCSFEK